MIIKPPKKGTHLKKGQENNICVLTLMNLSKFISFTKVISSIKIYCIQGVTSSIIIGSTQLKFIQCGMNILFMSENSLKISHSSIENFHDEDEHVFSNENIGKLLNFGKNQDQATYDFFFKHCEI